MPPRSNVTFKIHPWRIIPQSGGGSWMISLRVRASSRNTGPLKSLLPSGANKWELVWSDEFDGPDSDLDVAWQSQNSGSTHILSSRWRENAVVTNGLRRLVMAR